MVNIDVNFVIEKVSMFSLRQAIKEQKMVSMVEKLRKIVPDISQQESTESEVFNDFCELRKRSLQAFQSLCMLDVLETFPAGNLTVVDIGDSAGTHMLYLKNLTEGKFDVNTISVNLDERAIKKIEQRGLKAILSRAEDLDLKSQNIDFYTSFEMLEHLHNPSIFLHRLAKKGKGKRLIVTMPYLRHSRVGMHSIRRQWNKKIYAEDEHIFELSPEDWTLLFAHSGWKVVKEKIYLQYPKKWPGISQLFKYFWRTADFEGFWGAVLEKDSTYSDLYQDWED